MPTEVDATDAPEAPVTHYHQSSGYYLLEQSTEKYRLFHEHFGTFLDALEIFRLNPHGPGCAGLFVGHVGSTAFMFGAQLVHCLLEDSEKFTDIKRTATRWLVEEKGVDADALGLDSDFEDEFARIVQYYIDVHVTPDVRRPFRELEAGLMSSAAMERSPVLYALAQFTADTLNVAFQHLFSRQRNPHEEDRFWDGFSRASLAPASYPQYFGQQEEQLESNDGAGSVASEVSKTSELSDLLDYEYIEELERIQFAPDETPLEYQPTGDPVPLSLFCHPYRSLPEDCAVCQEEMTPADAHAGTIVFAAACGHLFHRECLDQWVNESAMDGANACPACRTVLCEARKREHVPS